LKGFQIAYLLGFVLFLILCLEERRNFQTRKVRSPPPPPHIQFPGFFRSFPHRHPFAGIAPEFLPQAASAPFVPLAQRRDVSGILPTTGQPPLPNCFIPNLTPIPFLFAFFFSCQLENSRTTHQPGNLPFQPTCFLRAFPIPDLPDVPPPSAFPRLFGNFFPIPSRL